MPVRCIDHRPLNRINPNTAVTSRSPHQ